MKSRLVQPATLVLFVIALGFGLRLFHLDGQSFWYDEAFSAGVARATTAQILSNEFTDIHPPLYQLILHHWLVFGGSDFAIRFLSTTLGVAAIATIYSLGRALFDDTVGLVAAAIAAVSPYQVFYSQEARMYTLLLLLSSMILLSHARILQTNSRRWWFAYTASAVLGLYAHYLTALLLASLHLHFAVHRITRRKPWRRLATSDGLVVLAFAPQLLIFVTQAQRVAGNHWIPQPNLAQLLSAPYALVLSQFTSENLVPLAFAAILFLFIITHLHAARELLRRRRESTPLGLLMCALWVHCSCLTPYRSGVPSTWSEV